MINTAPIYLTSIIVTDRQTRVESAVNIRARRTEPHEVEISLGYPTHRCTVLHHQGDLGDSLRIAMKDFTIQDKDVDKLKKFLQGV